MDREVAVAIEKVNRKVSNLERNAEISRPMRMSFPDLATLQAFTGWPGLIGFCEADNGEYVWQGGWKLWSCPAKVFTPSFIAFTLGNGTVTRAWYTIAGGSTLTFLVMVALGSTSAVTGFMNVGLPGDLSLIPDDTVIGQVFVKHSDGSFHNGVMLRSGIVFYRTDGVYAYPEVSSANTPTAWVAGDTFSVTGTVELATLMPA